MGALPLPAQRVLPGAIAVEVRVEGIEPMRKVVTLEAGQSTRVVFHPSIVVAPATVKPSSIRSPSSESTRGPRRTLGWTLVALGSVLLSEAVVSTIVRQNAVGTYNDDSRCLFGTLSREQRCGTYLGRFEIADVLTKVGYVGAAAAFGASAYAFLTSPPSVEPAAHHAPGVTAQIGYVTEF